MNAIPVPEYERRHNLIGFSISVVFHVAILAFFFFAMAWERQNPPPFVAEYGMEVNFGTSDEGFGDVQTPNPPGENQNPDQNAAAPVQPQESNPSPSPDPVDENVVTSNVEESVPVKASPEPTRPVQNANPSPTPTPARPTVNANSLYSPGSGGGGSSEGNDPGKTGDKGKPNGSLDARGMYDGTGGKGNLDMPGWQWDSPPAVRDESNEEGRIVFQVSIDENGEVISVKVLEKNVSPTLVRKYQKEVESLSFSRKSGGNNGEGATGRITFNIKSN